MDKKNRVEVALRHGEPDRVPRCELIIDADLVGKFSGKDDPSSKEYMDFMEQFGLDAVCLSPQVNVSSPLGFPLSSDKEFDPEKTVEDFFQYVYDDLDFSSWENYHEKGWFIFVLINGSMGEFIRILGFERFMVMLLRAPTELKKAQVKISQKHGQLAREAISRGAGAVILGDDIAYHKGPLISPEIMRSIFFPVWKEEAEEIRNAGVPVILHSEGNLHSLLPDLAEIYDGIHSLEPASHMSLKEIKRDYGHRLCLMGNIDLSLLYPDADLEELRCAVKEAMEAAKHGGGYIFGTTGGLCTGLSLDKIAAMYRFADKYG